MLSGVLLTELALSAAAEGALAFRDYGSGPPLAMGTSNSVGDKAENILSICVDLPLRSNVPSLPLRVGLLPLAQ